MSYITSKSQLLWKFHFQRKPKSVKDKESLFSSWMTRFVLYLSGQTQLIMEDDYISTFWVGIHVLNLSNLLKNCLFWPMAGTQAVSTFHSNYLMTCLYWWNIYCCGLERGAIICLHWMIDMLSLSCCRKCITWAWFIAILLCWFPLTLFKPLNEV